MLLIVASNKDVASLNTAEQLMSNYSFKKTRESYQGTPLYSAEVNGKTVKLATLNVEPVYSQNLTDSFSYLELVVFISRHSSVSGTPTLSVHTPGNLGQAELGGLPRKVSVSPANAMRDALKAMVQFKEEMRLDYEVSYECTHHGPSLNVPTMFAELGSSLEQWNDLKAAEVVGRAAMKAISNFGDSEAAAVLGIGGPHYNAKFTRMSLEEEIAFGHMIPKYALAAMDAEILGQCMDKTLEKVECVVLDWKGIKGEHKSAVVEMLREIDMSIKRV